MVTICDTHIRHFANKKKLGRVNFYGGWLLGTVEKLANS